MIPLVGYADRLSVRPGEALRFHVSNATGAEVSARLVRVISADANPAGPGIRLEAVPARIVELSAARAQTTMRGSFAIVDLGAHLAALDDFTLSATIWPTRLGHGVQPIL
jgi:N,N-dimethylformamidase